MTELTYTYRDNPYPEGTNEHQIWYDAFVHGLNSQTKQDKFFNSYLKNAQIKQVSHIIRIGKVGIVMFWLTKLEEAK
jgi:hypothetical protein